MRITRGFMVISDFCPYCSQVALAINEYNLSADPSEWIDIIDKETFDSRLEFLKEVLQSRSIPTPTGIIDDFLVNYIREYNHFLKILKRSKCELPRR